MLHATHVEPHRIGFDHPELSVRAVRVVGYRFLCSCGERGKSRGTYALARIDAQAHRAVTEIAE